MPADPARLALVVGAGRGIGRAVAATLTTAGLRVVGTHRTARPETGHDTGTPGRPPAAAWRRCDLAEPGAVEALIDDVTRTEGAIDVVVSSAAVIRDAMAVHTSDALWHDTLAVDLLAQQRLLSHVLPGMVERGWGRVVLISSAAAIAGSAGQSAYAAAKAATHGLARQAAVEVAPHGVTVNVVAPGAVDTQQLRDRAAAHLEAMASLVPAGRLGREGEVAAVVSFLCSDAASFVNGVLVPVDGGLVVGGGFVGSNRQRLRQASPPR